MHLSFKPYLLEFKHPFGVSSNVRTHTPTVFVRIEQDGFFGYGEACLPKYLGETTEDTLAFFEKAKGILNKINRPALSADIFEKLAQISKHNQAAKAAIDMALWDLKGKMTKKPLWELMGFNKSLERNTSCTIAIGEEKLIEQKIKEAEDFSILKIKAGTADDKKLVNLIRKFTNKPLYVDVNQGWKDVNFVIEMLHWFKEQKVLLVEQPMPVNMVDEMARVTEKSPIPTIADESMKVAEDLNKMKGVFSGINMKLMKCGGLTEALKIIKAAQQQGLKIMLGCMAESSCATTAMAHLMQFADFIDLDAPNLIVNDLFKGISYENGNIFLRDEPGIGVEFIGTW